MLPYILATDGVPSSFLFPTLPPHNSPLPLLPTPTYALVLLPYMRAVQPASLFLAPSVPA